MDKEASLLFLTSIIITIISITTAAPVFNDVAEDFPLERDCLYNGQLYSHSSSIETEDPCLNCTCNRGVLVCFLRVCPNLVPQPNTGCSLAKTPGTCCAEIVCGTVEKKSDENHSTTTDSTERQEDISTSSSFSSTVSEDSIEVTTVSPANFTVDDNSINLGCWLNGSLYAEGSAMLSSTFCEYCYCIRGEQRCIKPQCHLTIDDCGPIYHHGFSCCPSAYRCNRTASDANHSTTTARTTNRHDCVVNGKTVREGDPVVTPNVCSHCFCVSGKVKCSTVRCPLHINRCKPIIQPGKCCPTGYNCSYSGSKTSHREGESATELILGSVSLSATTETPSSNIADNVLYLDTEGSESQTSISLSLPISVATNESSNISNEFLSTRDNDRITLDEENKTEITLSHMASMSPLEILSQTLEVTSEPFDSANDASFPIELLGRHGVESDNSTPPVRETTEEESFNTTSSEMYAGSESSEPSLLEARNDTDVLHPSSAEEVLSTEPPVNLDGFSPQNLVGISDIDNVTGSTEQDQELEVTTLDFTESGNGHYNDSIDHDNSIQMENFTDSLIPLTENNSNTHLVDEHQGRIAPSKKNETMLKDGVPLGYIESELSKSENGTTHNHSALRNSSLGVAASSESALPLDEAPVNDLLEVRTEALTNATASIVNIFNKTNIETKESATNESSSIDDGSSSSISIVDDTSIADILLEAEESDVVSVTELPSDVVSETNKQTESNIESMTTDLTEDDTEQSNSTEAYKLQFRHNETLTLNSTVEDFDVVPLFNETVKLTKVHQESRPSSPPNNNRTLIGSISSIVSLLLKNTSNSSTTIATTTTASNNNHESDNGPHFSHSNSESLFNHADSFDALLEDLVGEAPGEVQFNHISYVNFSDISQRIATKEHESSSSTILPLLLTLSLTVNDTAKEKLATDQNVTEDTATVNEESSFNNSKDFEAVVSATLNETFVREDASATNMSTSTATFIETLPEGKVSLNDSTYPEELEKLELMEANSSSTSTNSSSATPSLLAETLNSNVSAQSESTGHSNVSTVSESSGHSNVSTLSESTGHTNVSTVSESSGHSNVSALSESTGHTNVSTVSESSVQSNVSAVSESTGHSNVSTVSESSVHSNVSTLSESIGHTNVSTVSESSGHYNVSALLESSGQSNVSTLFESSTSTYLDEPVFETAENNSSTTEFDQNDLEETLEIILNLSKTYASMNKTWAPLNSSMEDDLLKGNIPIEVEAKIAEIVRMAQAGLNVTRHPGHEIYTNNSQDLFEKISPLEDDFDDYYEDDSDGISLSPIHQNASNAPSNESILIDLHNIFIPLINLNDSVSSLSTVPLVSTVAELETDSGDSVSSSTVPPLATSDHTHHSVSTLSEVLSDDPKVDDRLDSLSQHFEDTLSPDEVHEKDKQEEEEPLNGESSHTLDGDDHSYFSGVEVVVPDEEKSYFGADDFNGGGIGRKEEEVGGEVSAADAVADIHNEEEDDSVRVDHTEDHGSEHVQVSGQDSDHFSDNQDVEHTESVDHLSGNESDHHGGQAVESSDSKLSNTDNVDIVEVPSSQHTQVETEDSNQFSHDQHAEPTESLDHLAVQNDHVNETVVVSTESKVSNKEEIQVPSSEHIQTNNEEFDHISNVQSEENIPVHLPENGDDHHLSSEGTVVNDIIVNQEEVIVEDNNNVPQSSTLSQETVDDSTSIFDVTEKVDSEVPETTIETINNTNEPTLIVPEATEVAIELGVQDSFVTSEDELKINDADGLSSSTLSGLWPGAIIEDHQNVSYPSFELPEDGHQLIDSPLFHPVAVSNEATTAFVGLMSKGSIHFDNVLPLSRRGRPNTDEITGQALPTPRKSSAVELETTNSSIDTDVEVIPFLPEDAITDELYQEPVKPNLAPRHEDENVFLTSTDNPGISLEQVLEKNESSISVRLGASSVVQVQSSNDDLLEVPKIVTDAETIINVTDVATKASTITSSSTVSASIDTTIETTSQTSTTSRMIVSDTTPLAIKTSTVSITATTSEVTTPTTTSTLASESSTPMKRKEEKRIDLPMPSFPTGSPDGMGYPQKPDYCVENGEVFQNGERIPTLDFCAQCKCSMGEILCQHVSCPKRPVECVERISPSSCCPTFVCNETEVDNVNTGSLPIRSGITIHGGFLPIEGPIMPPQDDRHLLAQPPPPPISDTITPISDNPILLTTTPKLEPILNDSSITGQIDHEIMIESKPEIAIESNPPLNGDDHIISNERDNQKNHESELQQSSGSDVHKAQGTSETVVILVTLPTEATTTTSTSTESKIEAVVLQSESTTRETRTTVSAVEIESNEPVVTKTTPKLSTEDADRTLLTTTTPKSDEVVRPPGNSLWAMLKVSSCNIYGRVYRLGSVIGVLSGPCKECKCTDSGVNCYRIKCF